MSSYFFLYEDIWQRGPRATSRDLISVKKQGEIFNQIYKAFSPWSSQIFFIYLSHTVLMQLSFMFRKQQPVSLFINSRRKFQFHKHAHFLLNVNKTK